MNILFVKFGKERLGLVFRIPAVDPVCYQSGGELSGKRHLWAVFDRFGE